MWSAMGDQRYIDLWLIKCGICIGYSTIETKEGAPYWILMVSFSARILRWRPRCIAPRPSPEYSCGKRNPLYPIQANSFVSIIMYPTCTIIVLLKNQRVRHYLYITNRLCISKKMSVLYIPINPIYFVNCKRNIIRQFIRIMLLLS